MTNYATTTMTCVDRYRDNTLKIKAKPFQYAVYRDGLSDSLYVTVNWHPDTSTSYVLENILKCTCNGTTYRFARTAGWADPVCVIPYIPESQSPSYTLAPISSSDALYYNNGNRTSLSFSPGNYTTLPVLQPPVVTLYANHKQRLNWTLTPGDSRRGWVTSLEVRYRDPGAENWNTILDFADSQRNYRDLETDERISGKEVCLALEYRTYLSNWGGELEDFVTLNWLVTPWQKNVRDAKVPLEPESISVSMLLAGGNVTVNWPAVSDPMNTISKYVLERSVNGGTYTQIYNGSAVLYQDTLPDNAETVVYRVCSVNASGVQSAWTKTGVLEVAQSNLYVGRGGKWVRAAGVWIGDMRASPMVQVKRN